MSTRILRSAMAFGVIAIAIPVSAFASGAYHPTASEVGATYHPDHASNATRDQIAAQLDQAKKHPSWGTFISRGAPWPPERVGQPKTRAQVNAELQAAMKHPQWNAISRGMPWPPASTVEK